MFNYCIQASEKAEDVPARLAILSDFVTKFMFINIQRGLFEEHKLLFVFLMCVAIFRHPNSREIRDDEWNFLLRGELPHARRVHVFSVVLLVLDSEAVVFHWFYSGAAGSQKSNQSDRPVWISASTWENINYMEATLPEFDGFMDNLNALSSNWKSW